MADDEALREKLLVEIKKARAKAVDLLKTIKDVQANGPNVKMSNLVKAYMDAIKVSDGLTSVRPATLKAIQTAEKSVTPASIKLAVSGLEDHVKDVTKAFGSDKAKKKEFDKFDKAMKEIVVKLKRNL